MSENEKKTISIFGRLDADDRGLFSRLHELRYGCDEIDVGVLKKRLDGFLRTMQEVIQGVPEKLGEFTIDTVSLTAEVSATGRISLVGTGGEMAGKGGLTITLKRRDKEL